MALVMGEQALGVGGQLEEIAFLLHPFGGCAARRELAAWPVREFVLVEVGLVAHRIPTRIFREIDVAVGMHSLPDRLARALATLLGRADDVVCARLERFTHGGELP